MFGVVDIVLFLNGVTRMAKYVIHHIFYPHTKEGNKRPSQREITCLLTNSEHQAIWRIQNRRPDNITKGFWHAMRVLMAAYEPFAYDPEESE